MSEDKQYDFYVAGPFFDPGQTASMERLEKVLEDHGRTLFKPRFASQIEEVGPEGCFNDDIQASTHPKRLLPILWMKTPAPCSRSGMLTRLVFRYTAISKT